MVGYRETIDDLVVQDRVPPRDGIDEWRIENLHVFWQQKVKHDLVEMMHGDHVPMAGMLHVRCRRVDLPPVESPDDWVPLTDPHHVLRRDIDSIRDRYGRCPENYEAVNGYNGQNVSCHSVISARCLRKHHPDYQAKPVAVEPQKFRIGDLVRFRGGMISFLVAWVAKDGMVRLADHHNPSYWCKPETLELFSRAEGQR